MGNRNSPRNIYTRRMDRAFRAAKEGREDYARFQAAAAIPYSDGSDVGRALQKLELLILKHCRRGGTTDGTLSPEC
jgi:hypothetical protein